MNSTLGFYNTNSWTVYGLIVRTCGRAEPNEEFSVRPSDPVPPCLTLGPAPITGTCLLHFGAHVVVLSALCAKMGRAGYSSKVLIPSAESRD